MKLAIEIWTVTFSSKEDIIAEFKKAGDQQCQYNESAVVTNIDSFNYFSRNPYALQQTIGNIGPVSAAIDGDTTKDYKSGIVQTDGYSAMVGNLSVLVVGYGSENGSNYWIVRNCFGSDWGENGYFRIANRPLDHYCCELYSENVYPIIY